MELRTRLAPRQACLALCAVFAAGCFRLPPTKTLLGDVQFKLHVKTLPSGMRIVLEEAPGTGRVAVMVGVGVGSSSDPVGKEGLAHLVEHLSFRARPGNKLTVDELQEFLGSSDRNGTTQFDLTTFQAFGVAESLVPMAQIEITRIVSPLKGIDARVFDLERQIVRNELRLKHETGIAGESLGALQALVFPANHPYARSTGGTAASLDALTLDDAVAFAAANYQPKNVTMVITGDFDAAAIETDLLNALPQSYLQGAGAPPPAIATGVSLEPPAAPARPPVVHAGVDRTHLLLAWPAPPEDGGPALIALQAELQAALSHRWTDKDISISAVHVLRGARASMLVASIALKLGLHPEESLAEVKSTLGLALDFEAPSSRRWVGKGVVLSTIVSTAELMNRAEGRLEGTCYANDPRVIGRTLKSLAELTLGDSHALAVKWLRLDRLRAVVVEPLIAQDTVAAPSVGVGLRPINVQIPADAVRKLARGPKMDEVKEFTLHNGLKVVAVRRPELPIVSLALALPGGHSRGAVGVSEMSAAFVPPGRRRSESAGGVYLIERDRETLTDATLLQWNAGNGNLPNLLALASNFMTDSELAEDEVKDPERILAHLEAREEVRQARDFKAALYRGAQVGTTMAMADATTALRQAPEWAKQVYLPKQSALAIVGDIDLATLEETAEHFIGNWKTEGITMVLAPAPDTTSRPTQVLVNNVPKLSLVSLHLGCLVPSDGDRLTVALLSTLLGQRLDRLWRQQLGLSYGVTNSWSASSAGSAIEIQSTLDGKRLTAALRSLKQEWEAELLSPEEIDRARWTVAAKRAGVGVTVDGLARYLALERLRGHGARDAAEAEGHVADIPATELQDAFELCRGSTVLRLDGDEAMIRTSLKEAGQ